MHLFYINQTVNAQHHDVWGPKTPNFVPQEVCHRTFFTSQKLWNEAWTQLRELHFPSGARVSVDKPSFGRCAEYERHVMGSTDCHPSVFFSSILSLWPKFMVLCMPHWSLGVVGRVSSTQHQKIDGKRARRSSSFSSSFFALTDPTRLCWQRRRRSLRSR